VRLLGTLVLLVAACSHDAGATKEVKRGSPVDRATSARIRYACARSIHVTVGGSDGNSGAAGSPRRTISLAVANAQAGDCVLVHTGIYSETSTISFSHDGTAAAPIVLQSVDGPSAAVIDAGGNRRGPTVSIRSDHVVVDGFEFRNSPIDTGEQVVHFDGLNRGKGTGSVLRNCKISGGHDHLKVNQASRGVTIENDEFYGSFGHIPISLTGAIDLVFRGNSCHDWSIGGDGGIQLKGGSHDVLFDGNRFRDISGNAGTIALGDGCDASCDIDPDHYAAARVRAINNLMVRVGRAFDVQGCRNCAVLGNTIVDSGRGNAIFKLASARTNGVRRDTLDASILDNLVVGGGDGGEVIRIDGASGQGLVMDYNLVFAGRGSLAWGASHPTTSDGHSLGSDPRFVAPSAGDYSLGAGSPARGAGVNLSRDVPHDFTGAPRPTTGPFDIGAFQSRRAAGPGR
jgi:hypothetical protein